MAATARVVENVGVGAYIGGALLLTDPRLLSAAASILTVEARHQTILNVLSSSGTAIPAPFDMAFTPSEVLAMAAPFFSGPCDVGIPGSSVLTPILSNDANITFASKPHSRCHKHWHSCSWDETNIFIGGYQWLRS